ncbi:hypothetical protein K432DRAFT_472258 [Lepidopterella palustris CBS 459.81]|uniref:Uncharacterized protein n=1 Tax=Lepidopterella palustris CBS 459.81 TaxID=1314670 RepID=A0A8E2EEB0_9PEZI|nr:hypothetical protein K432DRAFT_472258 [Lepidopterella palustris CBS 459.81]
MGEFTYTTSSFKHHEAFKATCLTYSDLNFSDNYDHAILALNHSKANRLKQDVNTLIAATDDAACTERRFRGSLFLESFR